MAENRTFLRYPRTAMAILTVAVALAACGGAADAPSQRPPLTVVATTTILGDIVSNVVQGDAGVVVLMPVGADPHDFRASAAQVAAINEADLVLANGLSLEEGLEDVLEAAVADGVRVLEVGPMIDPLPFGHDGNDHESDDPHVWLDPVRMAEAVRLIAAELEIIDPQTQWMPRADVYSQSLRDADDAIEELLAPIPANDRRLVTNHDSLGYFGDRYGFTLIGTVLPSGSTLGDPSSEELATLVEVMRQEGVTVIFAETTQPSVLADAVAGELGQSVSVVELYTGSLGEPGSGADTLIGMLETNAERIVDALDG